MRLQRLHPRRSPAPQDRPERHAPEMLIALVLAFGSAASLATSRDGDHDRARAALQSGEVLPLATVLERLQRRDPGEVLGVELEREDGRWVYEIRLLRPGGQLVRLELDARTADLLRERRRRDGR
jgi:uncharacterized membrane protein YkoI